jgi:hypothetical protein
MALTTGNRYSRASVWGWGLVAVALAGFGLWLHARAFGFAVGLYVISALTLAWVAMQAAQFAKHGDVVATFAAPGMPGGKLAGVIRFPKPLDARHARATLRCTHVYWHRQRGEEEEHRNEDLVWSRVMLAPIRRAGAGCECRVEFALPMDAQPTSSLNTSSGTQGPGIYWELEVTVDVPGLDLERSFIVQVGKSPA